MMLDLFMVELRVSDWPRSVAWYRQMLGLRVLLRVEADEFAILLLGPTKLALRRGEIGGQGVLLSLEVTELELMMAKLTQAGVDIEAGIEVSGEGYHRAVIRDPDGYRICLFDWGARSPSSQPGIIEPPAPPS